MMSFGSINTFRSVKIIFQHRWYNLDRKKDVFVTYKFGKSKVKNEIFCFEFQYGQNYSLFRITLPTRTTKTRLVCACLLPWEH